MSGWVEQNHDTEAAQLWLEADRLDTMTTSVCYAVTSADLGVVALSNRIGEINEQMQASIGFRLTLSASEVMEFDDEGNPKSVLPDFSRTHRALGRSGIFTGLALFDRADLYPNGIHHSQPWLRTNNERLEVCLGLLPDAISDHEDGVSRRTLVPKNKIASRLYFHGDRATDLASLSY